MIGVVQRLRGSVLGIRDFRLLWLGQAVSTVGDQIFPVAVTITVLNSGGGFTEVGLVLAARWLAVVLFALVGGVWADRLPRTLVMRGADVFRAAAVLGLAMLPTTPHVAVLMLLVFLVGGGEAFFRPAETALLPSILPPERLGAANALIVLSYRTASVVDPGWALSSSRSPAAPVRRSSSTRSRSSSRSSASRCSTSRPATPVAREERPGMVREISEGFSEVSRRPWVARGPAPRVGVADARARAGDRAAARRRARGVRHRRGVRDVARSCSRSAASSGRWSRSGGGGPGCPASSARSAGCRSRSCCSCSPSRRRRGCSTWPTSWPASGSSRSTSTGRRRCSARSRRPAGARLVPGLDGQPVAAAAGHGADRPAPSPRSGSARCSRWRRWSTSPARWSCCCPRGEGAAATAGAAVQSSAMSVRWKFWNDFDGVGPRWPW